MRAKRDRGKKKSRRDLHVAQVYKRVSEKKRTKRKDCLQKAAPLISPRLVERTVVIGELSQRQMGTKEHAAKQRFKQRAVFNAGGLSSFGQMLTYKCHLAGKALVIVDARATSKTGSGCGHQQDLPLWKRTYRGGNCGLVMDRDENSAVNQLRRFLARPVAPPRRSYDSFVEKGKVESKTFRTLPYLAGKPQGDNSMAGKQRSQKGCMVV